ncbi:MAG: hypothetical protein ACTHMY_21805 [Solirubrobacteraceae bacterium]
MLGIADPAVLEPGDTARALKPFDDDDDDNGRPGATADTSAANPAVSAAAPAITPRRVDLTRDSAASRSSTARDRSAFRCSKFGSIIGRENQRSVRPK